MRVGISTDDLGGHNSACNSIGASNSRQEAFTVMEAVLTAIKSQVPSVLGDAKDTEMLQSPREKGYQCKSSRSERSAGFRAQRLKKPSAVCPAGSVLGHTARPPPLSHLQHLLLPDCSPHPSVLFPWASCRPPLLLPEFWGQE